jgi:hypothetical protein
MIDPASLSALITGLVGAYKAYADYKAATAQATAKQLAAPAKSAEAAQGEQTAPIVKAAVQQHGEGKEQQTLTLFEGDSDTYETALIKVLTQLAKRSRASPSNSRRWPPRCPPAASRARSRSAARPRWARRSASTPA